MHLPCFVPTAWWTREHARIAWGHLRRVPLWIMLIGIDHIKSYHVSQLLLGHKQTTADYQAWHKTMSKSWVQWCPTVCWALPFSDVVIFAGPRSHRSPRRTSCSGWRNPWLRRRPVQASQPTQKNIFLAQEVGVQIEDTPQSRMSCSNQHILQPWDLTQSTGK